LNLSVSASVQTIRADVALLPLRRLALPQRGACRAEIQTGSHKDSIGR
jgi:hypothetical protein